MARTLIAYSTVDGHTLQICGRLRQVLEQMGHAVELVEIGTATDVDPAVFDRIVIGASIRYGKHRPDVYRFIAANRAALERKPSAFFSVNIVARKAGRNTPDTNPYIRAFRRKTTWVPGEVAVFAGKLDYPRYRLMDRQVIRLIMWLTGGPTDPTACIDFTDWPAVESFARRLATMGAGE
ncbi:MAG: menaquinone-dependent protoporphyrinogen IX dehydrogenase [Rhodocyclales bacterium]|nr:menaquinone-dependent protoporphyrinogen IX dehydrogenase [Rhodocyclales bacterium]